MADIEDIDNFKDRRKKVQEKLEAEKNQLLQKEAEDEKISAEILNYVPPINASKLYKNRIEAEKSDDDLRYMNKRYAFVQNIGGKPAVMCDLYNEYYKRKIKDFITPEALQMRYLPRIALETEGTKFPANVAKWWLSHKYRKDYATITFEPDKEPGEYLVNEGEGEDYATTLYYNMWEGFAIKPKKGCWKRTMYHMYAILCNSDPVKFRYVLRWFAWAVQNPGNRAGVAIIFKGKKGSGKGTILQAFVDIFGRHGLCVGDPERLTGKHNAHLENLSFLFADEAYNPGDREAEGIMKNLITEPSLSVEPKFRNLKTSRNCLHIAMATNADWVIPASEDERRFFINETDNRFSKGNSEEDVIRAYFDRLYAELTTTGKAAMLYDLLNWDLKGWNPRINIPETEELLNQIRMSYPKLKTAVFAMLENGVFPGEVNTAGEYQITSANFLEFLQALEGNAKFSHKSINNFIKILHVKHKRDSTNRYLIFPELGMIRSHWNKHIGRREWRTNEEWTVSKEY